MLDVPIATTWLDDDAIGPVAAALAHIGSHFRPDSTYDEIEATAMIREILEKNPLSNKVVCLIARAIELASYDPDEDTRLPN